MPRSRRPKASPAFRAKVALEMRKFAHGTLHSGSKKGPVVRAKKQAAAIAIHVAQQHAGGWRKKK